MKFNKEFSEEIMIMTARSLYDGGWRNEDKEEIREEYNFGKEQEKELDLICKYLLLFEGEEKDEIMEGK